MVPPWEKDLTNKMTRTTAWSYRREKDADARVEKVEKAGLVAEKSKFMGKWIVSIKWKEDGNHRTVPVRHSKP